MEESVSVTKRLDGLKVSGELLGAMMEHVTQDNLMTNAKERTMVTP